MLIIQCAIIFACLALGELIVWATGIKFPSSIIGMLLLALFLKLGVVKLHWVEQVATFLTKNLALFFIPAGVGVMLYWDLIKGEIVPIVGASAISTILVMLVTGWIYKIILRRRS